MKQFIAADRAWRAALGNVTTDRATKAALYAARLAALRSLASL